MEELATPKAVAAKADKGNEMAFQIKPEALTAKCTKRTKELAQPRKIEEDESLNVDPFKPKKNAINLKPEKLSPRVAELATPRGPIPVIKRGGD